MNIKTNRFFSKIINNNKYLTNFNYFLLNENLIL